MKYIQNKTKKLKDCVFTAFFPKIFPETASLKSFNPISMFVVEQYDFNEWVYHI